MSETWDCEIVNGLQQMSRLCSHDEDTGASWFFDLRTVPEECSPMKGLVLDGHIR